MMFLNDPIVKYTQNSAIALVKKTQEPGLKLQKADFFQEWYLDISPDELRRGPKNSPCAFFQFKMAAAM